MILNYFIIKTPKGIRDLTKHILLQIMGDFSSNIGNITSVKAKTNNTWDKKSRLFQCQITCTSLIVSMTELESTKSNLVEKNVLLFYRSQSLPLSKMD